MTHPQPATNPSLLYSAAQTRELDRIAIEDAGIPGYTLMTRAGEACWEDLHSHWPDAHSMQVFCGAGNNGGDGYVIARLALAANWQVTVLQLGDGERMSADARQARAAYESAGGSMTPLTAEVPITADIVVDALLGTGVDRPLADAWRAAVERINAAAVPVLAVDIPTGLHADTGAVLGAAIRADRTVTFIGRKAGLYTGAGPDHAGGIAFTDLGVPASGYQQVAATAELRRQPRLGALAQPRNRSAHKGQHGHVLVIGGDQGMVGAVRLAGEAALRSGAGLVSLATRPEHAVQLAAASPELMCHGVTTTLELKALIKSATVLLAGPGLGQSAWAQALLAVVLEAPQPLVLDADALNLLAREPARGERRVLTPHPGEAARLLKTDSAAIQADRFAAAAAISDQYGGTTVLKGAGTVIHTGSDLPVVCAAGNPGMATAGMGDVLAGVIAALMAQGLSESEAAAGGVCVHACAGDLAAQQGERGMTARDVIAALRGVLNDTGTPD